MGKRVRVYHHLEGYTLIFTGGDRHGKEYRFTLSLGEAEELATALVSRLIATIDSDEEPKGTG